MSIRYRSSPYRTTVKFFTSHEFGNVFNHIKTRKIFVIDCNVFEQYELVLENTLGVNKVLMINAKENDKQLSTLEEILNFFSRANVGRNDHVIAIGGGITTDITGFAASIFKRGCRLVFVPTTFVGMIDASVGGKNGINFYNDKYSDNPVLIKNLLGTFYPPDYSFIIPEFLESLEDEDILNGWAECIKVSLLIPNKLYPAIVKHFSLNEVKKTTLGSTHKQNKKRDVSPFFRAAATNLKKTNSPQLKPPMPTKPLIREAITLKEKLCRDDLYDRAARRKLNLGHTFAHVIETVSEFNVSHGQAVAIGIRAAANLSLKENLIDENIYSKIVKPLDYLCLPSAIPKEYKAVLEKEGLSILMQDKKKDEQLKIVLFSGFQNSRIVSENEPQKLIDLLLNMQ